jgi:hypothetical protein
MRKRVPSSLTKSHRLSLRFQFLRCIYTRDFKVRFRNVFSILRYVILRDFKVRFRNAFSFLRLIHPSDFIVRFRNAFSFFKVHLHEGFQSTTFPAFSIFKVRLPAQFQSAIEECVFQFSRYVYTRDFKVLFRNAFLIFVLDSRGRLAECEVV